ncbi:GPP34 family phosphoprotein [Streptomyces sp. NPDC090025]|uniref:GPP34 family phosphoprotein n=1 Tax=Streptomyces sp. NPDC090025 TaxID=3365922 RepID=UPI0038344537
MPTARDPMITAMDAASGGTVRQGELSLALAGAELLDLLAEEAATLDGDLIVPADRTGLGDALLDQAAAALTREAPYEYVEDWLWRRGRDLTGTYAAALAADGRLTRQRKRWLPLAPGPVVVSDTEELRHARERRASHEPVLTRLAAAAGVLAEEGPEAPGPVDGATGTVLAAVEDAVTELAAVRQRRDIEQAAFDNVWRAP